MFLTKVNSTGKKEVKGSLNIPQVTCFEYNLRILRFTN